MISEYKEPANGTPKTKTSGILSLFAYIFNLQYSTLGEASFFGLTVVPIKHLWELVHIPSLSGNKGSLNMNFYFSFCHHKLAWKQP